MKKRICMLLSTMIFMSTISVFGAEARVEEVLHTYTAKVGTTDFEKDGTLQPLDVEIYSKDGYVMLPLRTFLSAVNQDAQMFWEAETQTAMAMMGAYVVSFDVKENRIKENAEELEVFGRLEVKDGRLFVPLRNWKNILNACGYVVKDTDIIWNAAQKQATIKVTEIDIAKKDDLENPVISGEGQTAVYAMDLTQKYDELQNLGDGLFLAKKYDGENIGLGVIQGGSENTYDILDGTGKVYAHFDKNTFFELFYLGEGYFCALAPDYKTQYVIDKNGNTVFAMPYHRIYPFSDGLARVENVRNGNTMYGYVDTTGALKIPLQFERAEHFSEGLAAVRVAGKWGFIDTNGDFFVKPQYDSCHDFHEGLAGIGTENGVGYINQNAEQVIAPQYHWAGFFKNGTCYVMDEHDTTWLINQKGEKLKQITEGQFISYRDNENNILQKEEIVELPNGEHKHIISLYDETGEISYKTYELKKGMAEGLSPIFDEKTKKYGYVDEAGTCVIAFDFDYAGKFQNGYAVVARKIKWENGMEDVEWGIIKNPLA